MSEVDDIKTRLDILDVVSHHVPLQRSGRSYKAVCPFHTEKTPSFHVFPENQSWRCFGACATGGDVFSFVMRMENLDFSETLKRLAQQAGVKLPERGPRRDQEDILLRINEAAREFFCESLDRAEGGASARDYLKKRGVTPEAIEKFQIGLSPADGESLLRHLASRGYSQEQLALAGVVTQGRNGGYRDLFRRRLVIPIRDAEGRLAGFGGRALDDSNPKYLNTPRSPVFDKGHILYALYLAKESASERGIVVVEGYMDAIVAHQGGFSNVVASMGTALTSQQVALMRRLVRRPGSQDPGEVVLALDPDKAGDEATWRSLESSWNVFQAEVVSQSRGLTFYKRTENPALKIAPLPQGMDPDEIILESPEQWDNLVSSPVPLMEYLFEVFPKRVDIATPEGKNTVAQELYRKFITAMSNPFEQDHYFQRLAALLEVNEGTLKSILGQPGRGASPRQNRTSGPGQARRDRPGSGTTAGQQGNDSASPFARLSYDPLEERCLALLLQHPELWEDAGAGFKPAPTENDNGWSDDTPEETGLDDHGLHPEHFRRVENREVFANWMKCSTPEDLFEVLDDELIAHLRHLLDKNLPPSDRKLREADFIYCIRRLEERHLRELNREEELRLSQAAPEEMEEQQQRILQVNDRLNRIFGQR